LKNLISKVDKLPKEFRDKLYLMQYSRIQYWVEWQSKKRGLIIEFVNPSYSSVSCPKCDKKMREVGYRWFKCSCGYENDRNVIAMNLNGGLRPSRPPLRDASPDEGNPRPFHGGEEVSKTIGNHSRSSPVR